MLVSALLVRGSAGNTVDFRREQTRLLANFNTGLLILCGMTLIDCIALYARSEHASERSFTSTAAISGTVASVASFLIAKVPDWIGGNGGSKLRKFLLAHTDQAALCAAVVVLASIALIADLLVIKLLWRGPAWGGGSFDWVIFAPVMAITAILVALFGSSVNFANLLALTPLYASRLTRAYLGGSNAHRLDTARPDDVTHNVVGDDISLKTYMTAVTPAPIHLINVTRNRTVGEQLTRPEINVERDDPLVRESENDPRGRLASYGSAITLHDRHGDRMVFGPFGVRVGAEFFRWESMEDAPSVGLLTAISGAAVGSGMGRGTSLGTAMAMTLANMRLGYWWPARRQPDEVADNIGFLSGLTCLWRELVGQFGTNGQWLLSDGGHSENSGAMSLLERGCDLIVVCDNGQDPAFGFADLEIFVRTARTDIGLEVTVAEHNEFPANLKGVTDCFFNGAAGDWRKRLEEHDDTAFALLLKADDIPFRIDGEWKQRHIGRSWIVWIKPNRFGELPIDIASYAELNPEFPQQSTANQFFDEAQWESYRRLGFEMGRRLFASRDTLADYLPVIFRKPECSTGVAT